MDVKAEFLKALQLYLAEEGWLEDGWALGDWVLLVESTPFSDADIGSTRYIQVMPSESIPWHRIMGMIDVAKIELTSQMRDSG